MIIIAISLAVAAAVFYTVRWIGDMWIIGAEINEHSE